MAGPTPRRDIGVCVLTAAFLSTIALPAESSTLDKISSEVRDIADDAGRLTGLYLASGGFKGDQYVAERLIDGENFYRIKDYERAAIVFMDIIENHSDHAAYPDALFLYADSLFSAEDYLTAKDAFEQFIRESSRPGAARFKEKAVTRLIEIAVHLDSYEGVEPYLDELGQYPGESARYVKGKFYYFKGDRERAYDVLSTIAKDRLLRLKAQYLMGVILTLDGNYEDAIGLFAQADAAEATSLEEREILDLMVLGAGRLHYERGDTPAAFKCYRQITQNSRYFDAALYEAAAALVQAGDAPRAEQTLEMLTVTVPHSRYLPRAKMLRGNLLLKAGRYDDAERLFDEVIVEFTPVMMQLDSLIEQRRDTRQFFFELVENSVSTLDVKGELSPLVVKWVGEESDVKRALDLADDVGKTKGHLRETKRLIRLLEAVVDGPSQINAVPVLRQGKRRAQQLSNRLCRLRARLAKIAEKEIDDTEEASELRVRRLELADKAEAMPISDEGFAARERKSREIYVRMKAELQRNLIRLDRLSAVAVSVERFIEDSRYAEGVPAESLAAAAQELERHRFAIKEMHRKLEEIREDVEKALYQVGVGDSRDKSDEETRKRIETLTEKERELLRSAGGRRAARLEAVFSDIDNAQSKISGFEKKVESEAARRVERIRRLVEAEREHAAAYTEDLAGLGDDAEEVVGGVAFENFTAVRKRFYDLVLKADVGIVDAAWLRKARHASKINEFTESRLKEIKALDDEFQEVRGLDSEKLD